MEPQSFNEVLKAAHERWRTLPRNTNDTIKLMFNTTARLQSGETVFLSAETPINFPPIRKSGGVTTSSWNVAVIKAGRDTRRPKYVDPHCVLYVLPERNGTKIISGSSSVTGEISMTPFRSIGKPLI